MAFFVLERAIFSDFLIRFAGEGEGIVFRLVKGVISKIEYIPMEVHKNGEGGNCQAFPSSEGPR